MRWLLEGVDSTGKRGEVEYDADTAAAAVALARADGITPERIRPQVRRGEWAYLERPVDLPMAQYQLLRDIRYESTRIHGWLRFIGIMLILSFVAAVVGTCAKMH